MAERVFGQEWGPVKGVRPFYGVHRESELLSVMMYKDSWVLTACGGWKAWFAWNPNSVSANHEQKSATPDMASQASLEGIGR